MVNAIYNAFMALAADDRNLARLGNFDRPVRGGGATFSGFPLLAQASSLLVFC